MNIAPDAHERTTASIAVPPSKRSIAETAPNTTDAPLAVFASNRRLSILLIVYL